MGAVEARGLTVRYPDSPRPALVDLAFRLEPGELVAVVGPVGCGKTTLARALGRMVEVPPGQLFIDGVDVTTMALPDLRGLVALVPQEGYLFTASLADNLRYGEPGASLEAGGDGRLDRPDWRQTSAGFPMVTAPWWESGASPSAAGSASELPWAGLCS